MKKVCFLFMFFLISFPVLGNEKAFDLWKNDMASKALKEGVSISLVRQIIGPLTFDEKVIELDRRQPESVLSFSNYIKRMVTDSRILKARENKKHDADLFGTVEQKYGIPAHYLLAFWGLETNFGSNKGTMDVFNSLATLAYDKRRSDFFTQQFLTLLKAVDTYRFNPPKGSWAGAFGHFQFMPTTFKDYAVDADNDGIIDLENNFKDALFSAANYLSKMGWKKGYTWGVFVSVPKTLDKDIDLTKKYPLSFWVDKGITRIDGKKWQQDDLAIEARLLLPEGIGGSAFLVYRNFDIIKRWNNSDLYALAVGVLADNIAFNNTFDVKKISVQPNLKREDIVLLQDALKCLKIFDASSDGILGRQTKKAVALYQKSKGKFADGYLSKDLLNEIINACAVK